MTRTEHKKTKKPRGPLMRALGTVGLIILITGAMLACMAAVYIRLVIVPDSKIELIDYSVNLTSTVYYNDPATGQAVPLQQLHGSENRIWIPYEEIPKNLIEATIAIEDKRFYKHDGVDWLRTGRGLLSMFTGQKIQGGSTLTQQMIKNLTTENDVTVKRKVKEIFRALQVEKDYSKEQILEYYLNCIFLGEGCNGVYTASYAYFGKSVDELSLAECASLIGITNNPSMYNPYRNEEGNKNRQTLILEEMHKQKKISKEDYEAALAEPLQFVRGKDEGRPQVIYSWYIDSLIDEVVRDLMSTYNLSQQAAEDKVYSGGLKIYSNLNPAVQSAVEAVFLDRSNLNYTSASGQIMQSAITVLDNSNGNIVGIAGGMGEKTGNRLLDRANSSKGNHQPGSAFKPLAVYAPAIELGFITPYSVMNDSPVDGTWPKNAYTGYKGNLTIREAVRISTNTIAVKVLEKYVTPQVSFEFLRDRFNIHLVESRSKGTKIQTDIALAPLALGGLTDGVNTTQMAAAYATFPSEGVYREPSTYSRVVDNAGNTVLEKKIESKSVLKPKTTYYMNSLLENVVSAGTGTEAKRKFTNMPIAGKTGTTDNTRDIYFVGYTPYYTAAIWTGYDRPEEMKGLREMCPAAVLWNKVMIPVHANLERKEFPAPPAEDMIAVTLCKTTGLLSNQYCPSTSVSSIGKDDVPGRCGVHSKPAVPANPPTVTFDVNNPETWPKDDPNFRAEDPSTWPTTAPTTPPDAGEVEPPAATE